MQTDLKKTQGNEANTLLETVEDGTVLVPKPEYAHIFRKNIEVVLKKYDVSALQKMMFNKYYMVKP